MRSRYAAVLLTIGLLVAACGGDGDNSGGEPAPGAEAQGFNTPFTNADAYPIVVSSELVVGHNRFLIGLLDKDDAPIADPKVGMTVTFFDLTGPEPAQTEETDMSFIWALKPVQGLWVGQARFDHPGKWGAEIAIQGRGYDDILRTSFDVGEQGTTPSLGGKPPASDTPTAADAENLAEITSDSDPDPRFYETSIKQALQAGKPFVVVFATPKFCTSQVCGPTLDTVKQVSEGFPALTFIHVEVYTNLDDPSNLQTVPAVEEWGLPTEPWVFVVNDNGRIDAKYEGVVGTQELRAELRTL